MLKNRPQTLSAQRGVIMIIALIVLVAMTLGGIAMVRSVYTTNLIAGNLAFRESAVSSGDTGVEAAVAFLLDPAGCDLNTDCLDKGYSAVRLDPGANQSWDAFWAQLDANGQVVKVSQNRDAAGNEVAYTIHRLCNTTGAAADAACATSPSSSTIEGQDNSLQVHLTAISKVYYRITSRIAGPRNTLTYTQAIVSM